MRNGMQIALAIVTLCGILHASEPDEIPRTQLDNPIERILLCTPQGPLIVQLSLTVEGQPYRYAAENVVDEHFERIAAGARTWGTAFDDPQLLAGRLLRYQTPGARAGFIAKHDRDGNQVISRSELRSVLLDNADGDTLRILHGPSTSNSTAQLFSIADVNGDWRLSAAELQEAPARLAAVDFSGMEGLSIAELERADPRRPVPNATVGVLLGREGSSGKVTRQLRTHYANAQGTILRSAFAIAPELFDRLDVDRDGALQDSELLRIASLPAQITLSVDYANSRLRAP
ncbi:MAG TPA: hypothetical protein VHB77_16815, partial [Planctomycetaceae bacterium]|nr:hypothetical protein [Planctomycetaceae bacterium]